MMLMKSKMINFGILFSTLSAFVTCAQKQQISADQFIVQSDSIIKYDKKKKRKKVIRTFCV